MAPTQPARVNKETRLKALLAFAASLEAQLLAAPSAKTPTSVLHNTENHIKSFPATFGSAGASRCEEIDNRGTALWNLCTRLRRDYESAKPNEVPLILLLTRVLAFQLLDCAYLSGRSGNGNLVRLLKIGVKACKSCLEQKQNDLARLVLEKIAVYEEWLGKADVGLVQDEKDAGHKLVAEYYILRTAYAWQMVEYEKAEHMYKKAINTLDTFEPSFAESLADILYEMGRDLLGKNDYQMAVKWLQRAVEVLDRQELDRLSMDAGELRTSIMQSLIKALLAQNIPESIEKARSFIQSLENDVGEKLIVLLLRLELLSTNPEKSSDGPAYSDILSRMIRTMVLSDSNFKMIMFHIRKLNTRSSTLASKALDDFLSLRILQSDKIQWVERVLITRVWMTIDNTEMQDSLVLLDRIFSEVADNLVTPMGSAATLAAHTLIWKHIESNYTKERYEMTEKWCHIAMHRVFDRSSELNMGRISRKLLLCALVRTDIGSAREIFNSMSNVAKNEPISRFLMYKIAIRCEEIQLAAECLQVISSHSPNNDPTLLCACVLDAQQSGNKIQALAALQMVIEKYGHGSLTNIHIPSLLRSTIGLMSALLEEQEGTGLQRLETTSKLCTLFEKAAAAMRKPRIASITENVWTLGEIHWFSKNSYNLAIKHISTWDPRQSIRMLQCCLEFIDQYPKDVEGQISDDLSLRKMFCEFSAAVALVALARSEDNIELQLQDYLSLRKHVTNFGKVLQDKIETQEEVAQQDLSAKWSILTAFDFEAACRLKTWNDLNEIARRADTSKSVQMYEIMADCLLSSQAPTQVLTSTMKIIINSAWNLDTMDTKKLAKYMRCLFQIAISDNSEIADQLLDQVLNIASDAEETDQPYPTDELEWIATKAFNHAVDLYCTSDDHGSKIWAGKALQVAHYCTDRGALEQLLQTKLLELKFDA